MEEIKLNNDVIEQIKGFNHQKLTKEQESLIDKLILNEKLKECYKKCDLCKECKQPNTDIDWCYSCNSKNFQKNFINWSSGNNDIDKFIQKNQLLAKNRDEVIQWIEYDEFENIENLSKGGFGTIYKAIWKNQNKDYPVALKCFINSQDMTAELLREVESHVLLNRSTYIVHCYGLTKNTKSDDFMMVLEYAENGSLRQYLNNNFNSLKWNQKLQNLLSIACGLKAIHNIGLIHNNLHCSNILSHLHKLTIADLGLCQPANVKSQNDNIKIHRVLPYVAPEVLRGEEYTKASDIYSFGIIAHEICTGMTPYNDMANDEFLDIKICQGLRPKSNYKIPQLIFDVINQCWDADPLNRPNADELEHLLNELYLKIQQQNSDLNEQIKEANEINLSKYRLNVNNIETEYSGTL
ncbi:kinase-like domain-containing protein [Rhizophagus diaphanus]|nr:kinase-like domain-containing protein [Rhizophagus diaphanus] [Rhizophagus sp. MUCL 43196]